MSLLKWLWEWLDAFIFGKVVRMECEYCSYTMQEREIDAFEDEDALIEDVLVHPCHVKSRRQIQMVSRRFGILESSHIISKSLWGNKGFIDPLEKPGKLG